MQPSDSGSGSTSGSDWSEDAPGWGYSGSASDWNPGTDDSPAPADLAGDPWGWFKRFFGDMTGWIANGDPSFDARTGAERHGIVKPGAVGAREPSPDRETGNRMERPENASPAVPSDPSGSEGGSKIGKVAIGTAIAFGIAKLVGVL
jgi:hypothetical protein